MSQTLSGYITEVRRLLHDANGNFYTDTELTDYINDARERLVRDTGCLRIVQISQTPLKVRSTDTISSATPTNPTAWAANTIYSLNDFVFSNIFIYQVTLAGTSGDDPPAYPAANYNYPPTTQFLNGTAGLTYVGNCENIYYASLPQGIQTLDDAKKAAKSGADAVILSNHGGRQLDRAPVPLMLVEQVSRELKRDVEVHLDSGIMSGADIVAAIALGANFTYIGKAYLYGLMAGGQEGVERCLSIIESQIIRTMKLLGVKDLKELTPKQVKILGRLQ